MVDGVTMGQVSLRVLHPFSTGVFPSVLYSLSFIHHLRYSFLAIDRIDNTPSIYGNEYLTSCVLIRSNKMQQHAGIYLL